MAPAVEGTRHGVMGGIVGHFRSKVVTEGFQRKMGNSMGNSMNEKLSAWVDDELGEFEMRRVTDELMRSETARSRVRRYRLIGAAMREEPDAVFDPSLSQRIMEEIEALPEKEQWDLAPVANSAGSEEAGSPYRGAPWLKVFVGGAIAASVALISLAVFKSIGGTQGVVVSPPAVVSTTPVERNVTDERAPAGNTPVMASRELQTPAQTELARPVSSPVVVPSSVEPIPPAMPGGANARLLGGYLATHAEHAARRSVLPRARIMGFDIPVDESR